MWPLRGGVPPGVPPPNDGSYWMYCITSSVHSYLRYILTAGDGGEVVSAGDGGGCRLFFYFTNHMFERFTPKYSISFFYSGFASFCTFHNVWFLPYHIPCHIISRWREIGDITTIDSYYGYGGFRPPTTGLIGVHRITSSVHSYRRSISTAGLVVYFFTFDLSCSRDLL